MGAIRTLLAIERSVREINAATGAARAEEIRESIKRNIAALPAGVIGTPFAQMTERMSGALEQAARLESELAVSKAVSDMAAQVAHDISSPLAALGAAAKGMEAAPKQRQVIDGAVQRIQGIADDLLKRYRAPGEAVAATPALCDLAALAAQVVEEKRLQHAGRAGLEIEFSAGSAVTALADAKEFQRIVSNLVNNAVEALGGPGKVSVALSADGAQAVLEIKDNGRGIPPETLARLGQKGETHGKQGGTGLGLYHARISAESWGGGLEITSEVGRGTTVTMRLPLAAKPEPAAVPKRAVLIDDDALTHMTWELAAQAKGVELLAFTAPGEFLARLEEFPKGLPIYIDSDLGGGVKGESIAADLRAKGYNNLNLATGHLPEKFTHLPWLKVQSKEPPWQ